MTQIQNVTLTQAIFWARHDIISDAVFGVLKSPEAYKATYNRICDDNQFSDELREAFLKGVEQGFDEALS